MLNTTKMNGFEKRINALRLQFRDERISITKDAYRHIGHINNAISQTSFPEVREALRAEKERIYEAMRTSHRYNRLCYIQQLEAIEDEARLHREKNPSGRQLRHMVARLGQVAEAKGEKSLTITFGDNRQATISFS